MSEGEVVSNLTVRERVIALSVPCERMMVKRVVKSNLTVRAPRYTWKKGCKVPSIFIAHPTGEPENLRVRKGGIWGNKR